MSGRFIAFEGGEASGKSTQADLLADRLGAVRTREPGGTEVGRRIRDLLLSRSTVGLSDRAEALLMAADRAQHVAEVVRPALERGEDVVTDRFAGSSLAYQGFGRGLPIDDIRRLVEFACEGVRPDLIVLLRVPVDVATGRLRGEPDRFEGEDQAFHERVVDGFGRLAAEEPDRWVVIDGTGSVEAVTARVREAIEERLG